MPSRRTGITTEDAITKYSVKAKTEQTAYKNATKDMVVQAQNIMNFYSVVNQALIPWLNAHGVGGNLRILYRQLANEYVKVLNTKQSGEVIKRLKIALRHKYWLRGLDEAMLDEFMDYIDSLKSTTTNYIIFNMQSSK
ncbi:major capsid protein VP4 [Sulfolobus filamentous virus 1]|uniref:Major capsid protein VP4 n=2 Tax=Alphalipothrixvirus beppuense TaxID=2734584 RepID=CAPS1_SUFV1|nr:major capsid protein VP4 [Sulfolobus filamentous virus 1]A0A346LU62.1 RecName: Full=Major capsid protein VP4 [Sulfolobus filamentous virus 1]6D5F_a Chain a, Fimbrial protein [Sulfolobus filamentous virus 1]6D5F_b Chain b, Fimbrial protein [Sulfolobus filamentous virus 1]6D5F_c Chain c, Fimbrial protein [Sulfolobus filamentous virus 1]6D5F_d Chain d, Fimbrial protein [Sulfolobus filamentous virus 1]6D5F_e Chain e, Fimbrial protein [Sulfolobus filamentous virus 1]6D5F_f Chain f, Fimbrial pr